MPGLIKPNAVCPKCDTPIIAIVRLTNSAGVEAEYFHERLVGETRRKRRCKIFVPAVEERKMHSILMQGK